VCFRQSCVRLEPLNDLPGQRVRPKPGGRLRDVGSWRLPQMASGGAFFDANGTVAVLTMRLSPWLRPCTATSSAPDRLFGCSIRRHGLCPAVLDNLLILRNCRFGQRVDHISLPNCHSEIGQSRALASRRNSRLNIADTTPPSIPICNRSQLGAPGFFPHHPCSDFAKLGSFARASRTIICPVALSPIFRPR
jgi:hypothetical protein